MGSVAEAKRAYFKGVTGSTQNAVNVLDAKINALLASQRAAGQLS